MGNSLPCLGHGGGFPMDSNSNKGKLHPCDVLPRRLHKMKKTQDQSDRTTTNSAADDHLKVSEKEVTRVKVMLTKKEAAQLLSMWSSVRGEKSLAQIMTELKIIDQASNTTKACSFGSSHGGWKTKLESIPEES